MFGDVLHRNPQQIAQAWGSHFEGLYSDTESTWYDREFYDHVTSVVRDLKSTPVLTHCDFITVDHLNAFVKKLNCNKMCGIDNVYNEHILYGGEKLIECLTALFNLMYTYSYVPHCLKKGCY